MFYSAETGGFYHPDIHPAIPADAVEISAARHAEILDSLSNGQMIQMAAGEIQLVPAPPPSAEHLMQILRNQRDRLLADCDWTQMPDAPLGEAAREAWRVYRQALRDLPETITDPADILWPEPPIGEPL